MYTNQMTETPFPQPVIRHADTRNTALVRRRDKDKGSDKSPEAAMKGDLFLKLSNWLNEGADQSKQWREEADLCYEMVDGHQWDTSDVQILNEDGRPCVTFNRLGRNVDLIGGHDANSTDEVLFYPRENGDAWRSEILTAAVSWINDETDSATEKADAFRDLCICGMGWTDTDMNYLDHEDGMPVEVRRDPREMYWDCYSTGRNGKDTRWRARAITMPTREAMDKYPEVDPALLHAAWANLRNDPNLEQEPDRQTYSYEEPDRAGQQPALSRVTMIEMQYFEIEKRAIVEDIFTGERKEMPYNRAQAVIEAYKGRYRAIPVDRKVFYRAIIGAEIISVSRLDAVKDFPFQMMTGKRDRKIKGWYGMVRAMIDPQKWANKWLSQSMHILNSNGKGGVIFEEGSFTDPRQAEANWGRPGSFTRVKRGVIAEGRIQERTAPQLPSEIDKLLPFGLSSIQDCGGVPVESLGQVNGADPQRGAYMEAARREAGLVLMQYLFEAKKLFVKRQGRVLLRYIMSFMNDGRLVRIVEEGHRKFVPLIFDDPQANHYDIVVDDAPDSPNQKQKTWQLLERFLPFIERLGAPPKIYADILAYSPLPTSLVNSIQETLTNEAGGDQEQPEADPVKMAQAQVAQAKLPAEIARIEAEIQRLHADAARLQSQMQLNLAKAQESGARVEMDALEGIRETIALDDARDSGRMSAHEAA